VVSENQIGTVGVFPAGRVVIDSGRYALVGRHNMIARAT